jgi:hypothetical protein
MFTTTVTTSVSQNLDFLYETSDVYSASAKLSINETIPSGSTNVPVNFSFSTGSGIFLALASNIELYPLIVKTNDSVAPTNTFNLTANGQKIYTNFLTQNDSLGSSIQNINVLYVSNTGTLPASLRIDSLFDGTPNI